MKSFIICDKKTGEILKTGFVPEENWSKMQEKGKLLIDGSAFDTPLGHYVDLKSKQVFAKTVNRAILRAALVDVGTPAWVTDAPEGSVVMVTKPDGSKGLAESFEDGRYFMFTPDQPGNYEFEVSHISMFTKQFLFIAVEVDKSSLTMP